MRIKKSSRASLCSWVRFRDCIRWVFALAGGLAMLIALVAVSTQAMRAALANPVDALRYEEN